MTFNIKSVAIIGAGPSGLAALYEFLHTSKEGTSTFGSVEALEIAFEKIVVFEQKSGPGGVWCKIDSKSDSQVPLEEITKFEEYFKAATLQPNTPNHEEEKNSPTENKGIESNIFELRLSWDGSALFSYLFTNVPKRYTRFSSMDHELVDDTSPINPFIMHHQLNAYIENFIEKSSLEKYIRYNTEVRKITKRDGEWHLALKHGNKNLKKVDWYEETFDAIVVANGHYNVPYIPYIEGLKEYAIKYPSSVIHSKFFRGHEKFRDKKVVLVGSSISGLGLTQYIKPVSKDFILSRRLRDEKLEWMNDIIRSEEFKVKPPIKKFIPNNKEIEFEDGSKVRDFDFVLLTTGYHYHYPFFEENFLTLSVPENKAAPANNSRVKNLYYNIFKIDDPTLAFVGIIQTVQLFTSFEAQAAAIAGIWSNAKKLPSEKEQYEWEDARVSLTGDTNVFHMFSNEGIKNQYIDKIVPFFPFERPYPLGDDYFKHFDDFVSGETALKTLFFNLLRGKLIFKDGSYIATAR
ncbi:uncharacterized protein PRCAT00001468001 [Priceomyces carsonii]|uniref:uncharacterized protein n=1 Tax=Priceomyces carsonii TaxID=28549 RepID=UPI002EDAA59F|nr:unnamed protein product [Priceomyces carsonii]